MLKKIRRKKIVIWFRRQKCVCPVPLASCKKFSKKCFFFSQKSVLHNSVRFPDWKKWIAKNAQKLQLFILFEKNVQKGVWNKSIKGFANELR